MPSHLNSITRIWILFQRSDCLFARQEVVCGINIIGSDALTPIICDVETGEKLHELSICGVMDMLFTPDGNYLITGSRDKTAKIWDHEIRVLYYHAKC